MCLALKKPYNPLIALSIFACSISAAGLSLNEIWFQAMPPPLLIPRDDTLFYSLRVLGGSACYLSSSLGFVELIWFAKKRGGDSGKRGMSGSEFSRPPKSNRNRQTDRHEKIGVFVSQSTWFLKKAISPSIYGRQKNMRCGRIQKLFPFLQHEFSQTRPSLYVFWMIYIPWPWCQKE